MIAFSVISHPKYKYRLDKAILHQLLNWEDGVKACIDLGWAEIRPGGLLYISRGYCWDGASGPAIDTMSFARASLVHDALYQLIAAGHVPKKPWKAHADRELYDICREDGMGWLRAKWVYLAVKFFGGARDQYSL